MMRNGENLYCLCTYIYICNKTTKNDKAIYMYIWIYAQYGMSVIVWFPVIGCGS